MKTVSFLHYAVAFGFIVIAAPPSAPVPPSAYSEDFYGEERLVEELDVQERLVYGSLRYLMNRYQRKQFLMLEKQEDRREWIEDFWSLLDPTPTTERNERRIEHERRVLLAMDLYFSQKYPGWDRRGEILIRFGRPDSIDKTWALVGFYDQRMPGEIWYYDSLGFLVSFVDEFLNGNYTYMLDHYTFDLLDFAKREDISLSAREEIEKQESARRTSSGPISTVLLPQHLDPDYEDPSYAMNPDVIESYIAGKDTRVIIDRAENNRPTRYDWFWADKARNNFSRYMKERPFIHTCELVENVLPAYFDMTAFRGGPGMLRTEVNFEVPTSEVRFGRVDAGLRSRIELRVQVRDFQRNDIGLATGSIIATAADERELMKTSHLPGQVVLTLEPGYYRLAIEAIDWISGRRNGYNTNLHLDCLDGRPALSDIQFASSIRETEAGGRFVKGNLEIVPHPLHAYRIPYPVVFYFEIYGLDTDREDLAFYSVEYSIVPVGKKRWGPVLRDTGTVISSGFDISDYGSKQVQRLEIATDRLWEGVFRLNVKVTDRRTYDSSAKSARFSILE